MAKTIIGVVSSDKTDKTIVVSVATRKTHPLYKKQYTSTKKFMAHDENNEAHIGDRVVISETRPLSARKRFKLDKVLEKAAITHVEQIDPEVAEVVGETVAEEEN
jgi:small subunit ribosomal protein S17